MSHEPGDPRRAVCDELAALLASEEGLRAARLMQKLLPDASGRGLVAPSDQPSSQNNTGEARQLWDAPFAIGPWEPHDERGELVFVRRDLPVMGDPWNGDEWLRPKTSMLPLRIVLLGESTAAGWFYAPHVTPACVLEAHLRRVKGPGIFEVVDLTRTDLGSHELVSLAAAALQLKPDLLVVFAGNNWPRHLSPYPAATIPQSQEAALAFRQAGAAGLKRLVDEATRQLSEEVLAGLAQVARAATVPVVLVVPEVNLADWERPRPAAWLRGAGARDWHALRTRALSLMRRGNWIDVADLARTMADLDEGTCASSVRLLARALTARGESAEMYDTCTAEVDRRAWDNVPLIPGASSTVREALRRGAREYGFALVDLPAIVRDRFGTVPGRRVFLDYCHLTLEGMHVAMAAVAAEILSIATPGHTADVDWHTLAANHPLRIAPEADARAKFMSALYNAHWNDPVDGSRELVDYWLKQAVGAWGGIAQIMLDYLATRAAPAEALLVSTDQQRLFASANRLRDRIWNVPTLDPDASFAIAAVLKRAGWDAEGQLDRIQQVHAVTKRRVNLLATTYRWTAVEDQATASGFTCGRQLVHRAMWPSSSVCLVGDGRTKAAISLTARLVPVVGPRSGPLAIAINGIPVGDVTLCRHWRRHHVVIENGLVRPGLNRLTLNWPALPTEGDAAIAQIVARLEQGVPTELHPIFGELFALDAEPAA